MRDDFPTCPLELTPAAFCPRSSAGPSGWGAPIVPHEGSHLVLQLQRLSRVQGLDRTLSEVLNSPGLGWTEGLAGADQGCLRRPRFQVPSSGRFMSFYCAPFWLCSRSLSLSSAALAGEHVLFYFSLTMTSALFVLKSSRPPHGFTAKNRAALTRKCAAPGMARCVCGPLEMVGSLLPMSGRGRGSRL